MRRFLYHSGKAEGYYDLLTCLPQQQMFEATVREISGNELSLSLRPGSSIRFVNEDALNGYVNGKIAEDRTIQQGIANQDGSGQKLPKVTTI
ncbi:MAG: hypothetical protein LBS21_13685 [Clostridiales bacterium]|jgi:hypothetical protein|nr:hypothetical protein [Clostridiales bacterium]